MFYIPSSDLHPLNTTAVITGDDPDAYKAVELRISHRGSPSEDRCALILLIDNGEGILSTATKASLIRKMTTDKFFPLITPVDVFAHSECSIYDLRMNLRRGEGVCQAISIDPIVLAANIPKSAYIVSQRGYGEKNWVPRTKNQVLGFPD